MKGLIFKDLLNLRKYSRTLLLVIGFYLLFSLMMDSVIFLTGMVVMMMTMSAISSFSYDDLAKWDVYALTLPVSRRDMVLSKYLLALLLAVVGSCVSLLFGLAFSLFKGEMLSNDQLLVITAVFAVSLIFISILFPLIYRFGVEKSRMFIMIIFAAPTAAFFVLSNSGIMIPSAQMNLESIILTLVWISPAAVAALFWLSYRISCRIYVKKDI